MIVKICVAMLSASFPCNAHKEKLATVYTIARRMVEARRIELLSENRLPQLSTGVVIVLGLSYVKLPITGLVQGQLLIDDKNRSGFLFTFTANRRSVQGRGTPRQNEQH